MELEIHQSTLLDYVLGQMNLAQTYFFKVSFNIFVPSTTLLFPENTALSWIAEMDF
jgi:hypothetical protein